MRTLIDLFDTFPALGEKTAFVNRTGVRRVVVSYGELHDLSLKTASLLAQRGVGKGDRVLIWGPNSSWWAVAYWGILVRGAIAVPVDFMSDLARADSIRNLTEAKLVLQSRFKPERVTEGTSILLEDLSYLLQGVQPIGAVATCAPEATAQLIYTSGNLVNLLARVTGSGASGIREDSLLVADLGLTSIDRLELVNFLEQEYRHGKLLPFQAGLGLMVKALGIPVVPVSILGTDQVLPHGAKFPKRGTVRVSFGEPLRFQYEEPAEIVETTRRAVQALALAQAGARG